MGDIDVDGHSGNPNPRPEPSSSRWSVASGQWCERPRGKCNAHARQADSSVSGSGSKKAAVHRYPPCESTEFPVCRGVRNPRAALPACLLRAITISSPASTPRRRARQVRFCLMDVHCRHRQFLGRLWLSTQPGDAIRSSALRWSPQYLESHSTAATISENCKVVVERNHA